LGEENTWCTLNCTEVDIVCVCVCVCVCVGWWVLVPKARRLVCLGRGQRGARALIPAWRRDWWGARWPLRRSSFAFCLRARSSFCLFRGKLALLQVPLLLCL
jgi:hypothetical protein